MQLHATAPRPAPPAATVIPHDRHDRAPVIRRGTEPADGVIAQALVELPMNYGMHGLIDVSVGRTLGEFDSIEAAREGAHRLATAHGLPTVGIVRRVVDGSSDVMHAVELLVPDFQTAPFDQEDQALPGWDLVRPTPLRLGRDAAIGNRFIEALQTLDRDDQPWLVEVATPSGVRLEFEYGHTPRVRTSRVEFG